MDRLTKTQYGLMAVFGLACIVAALAPLQQNIRIAAVSMTFGLTVGLWLSHLLGILDIKLGQRGVQQ
ncbi:MAG: hypothetical protein V5A36_01675 [Natronomonas sp.]